MIRKFKNNDLEKVIALWLEVNNEVHGFLGDYWEKNLEFVKEAIGDACIYVYEVDGEIVGFIGLSGFYIEGLFISRGNRNLGAGKALLDYVKSKNSKLILNVYEKNRRAYSFYKREEFTTIDVVLNEDTLEKEIVLEWKNSSCTEQLNAN